MGYLVAVRWALVFLSLFASHTPEAESDVNQSAAASAMSVYDSLELNQSFIEDRRPELRDATDRHTKPGALRLIAPDETQPAPEFDDPRSVVRFLLGVLESGTVYPTEGYFYFRFDLGERRVSGNLRFTSIDEGVLHTGYFETQTAGAGAVRTASLGAEQGLTVGSEPLGEGGTLHRVTLDGETTTFVIPRVYRDTPPAFNLRDGERLVSGVLDESGYALVLIFDEHDQGFRYLLHGELEPPEEFEVIGTPNTDRPTLFAGRQSGFVFIADESDRLTLVGVDRARIMANDYFDGPFDQVPPDLGLRPMLHLAYPYTRTASPVDEHGNFLGRESSRVAIAPYTAYAELDDLIGIVSGTANYGNPSTRALLQTLTREYQQDFVPPLRVSPIPDALPVGPEPLTLQDILERRTK